MHRSAKTPIITPWNSVPFIDFPFTINATCDRAIAAFCAAAISSAEADSAASSAGTDRYVYFVHSYYPTLCQDTIATCVHGKTMFSAALKYENFYATQFHPEKSGAVGETILRNFISL